MRSKQLDLQGVINKIDKLDNSIDKCIWQVENDEFGNEKMQSLPSR